MTLELERVTDSILRAGLLNDEELSDACRELERVSGVIDGARLLAHLAAEGRLTAYQVHELERGRGQNLVFGNYVILSQVGEGGMGIVYKALHRRMNRVVAVKVIKKQVSTPEFIARFHQEIRTAARLNHPHVVLAYDADECELGDYLVMEYVEGTDLDEVLKRTGPLSQTDAVDAVRQAALGLAYAHQQGVIHRDVKPANLMRDIHGHVKVADLGLARATDPNDPARAGLTQSGIVAGTVDFMPPEQAISTASVDHRADVYSLGCTLFFLLTGGPVFADSSIMNKLLAHREQPPPSLAHVCDGVSAELDAVFQRMVAKKKEDRFHSMTELVEALDGLPTHGLPTHGQSPLGTSPGATTRTVLIVEGSKLQASMIRKLLSGAGGQTTHLVHSGREALDWLTETSADAVLCSMQLPDMTGVEVASRVRDDLRWSRVGVVLMVSGELPPAAHQAIGRLGAVDWIRKPFDGDRLWQAIDGVVDGKPGRPGKIHGLAGVEVLIVDDSSVARRNVQKTLSELGFDRFTTASDGREAVEQLADKQFGLVVTDYHMPRMNGYELVSHIRQQGPQQLVPIVMVTTEFDPAKLAEVYQLGVSAICNKSFEPDLVRNIVVRLFG